MHKLLKYALKIKLKKNFYFQMSLYELLYEYEGKLETS